MVENLGKNDPYNKMNTAKDDIRPDYLPRNKNEVRNDEAAEDLRRVESGASDNAPTKAGDNLIGARENEEAANGFYRSSGRGEKKKGKGKGKGLLKRKGPMALIFCLIGGVGGVMLGTQSIMPFAIEEMLMEKFNSIGISSTLASDAWLDVQLNQGIQTDQEQVKVDTDAIHDEKMFAFSDFQVQQFENHGIEVVEANNSGAHFVALLYKKDDLYVPVVGSEILSNKKYNTNFLKSAIGAASGYNNIGELITAKEALEDIDFKKSYTAASKTWRGGISGWFDNIMSNVTEVKLSITRNRWTKWTTRTIKDMTTEFKKIADGDQIEKFSDDGVAREKIVEEDEVVDGEKIEKTEVTEIEEVDIENSNGVKTNEKIEVSDDKIKNSFEAGGTTTVEGVQKVLTSKAVKAAAAVGEYGCAVLEGLISVYTTVSAYQSMQFLNLISGFLESVDKVKVGEGDSSPIAEYSGNLVTNGTTTNDLGEVVTNEKNAMQSIGMSWLFGGGSVALNASDPSVRSVNFEAIMSDANVLFDNITTVAEVYEKCGYIKAGVAAVDLATTALAVYTGGLSKVFSSAIKGAGKVVIKAAVRAALMAIIPIAANKMINLIIKSVASEWFGEDLGNAIITAGSKYLGGNASSGGEGPGSIERVEAFLGERDAVIADEAKYQRLTRSPFDITSKYTFLGSLMYAAIPLAYSGNNIISMFAGTSGLLSSAIIGILPTATAINEHKELTSVGNCALLESTGAVGDAFCNPYIVTDTSTINESPIAINDIVHRIGSSTDEIAANDLYAIKVSSNFEDDGSIRKDSNLAKYIKYCGQRTSSYGLKDAAIADDIVNSDKSTVTKIMEKVPVISDVAAVLDGIKEGNNVAWVSGSACVASDENEFWNSEYKYYQRYAENERLLENMNPGYKSTVTAFLEDYYKENPVDDSFEGRLARFSGLSKEEVEDTLALIDYYNYIADYDATTRYAFGAPVVEEPKEILFDNENEVAKNTYIILLNEITFADVRNRNFVV